jgi:hypothetical protein
MFGRRRRPQSNWQQPPISAHPIDLFIAHNKNATQGDALCQQIALDFLGGGVASTPASVRAAKRPPTRDEQDFVSAVVMLVLEEIDYEEAIPEGRYKRPLPYAAATTLQHEMNQYLGIDDHEGEPSALRWSIAVTAGAAAASVRAAGRMEDAFASVLMGGCLYLQADAWLAAR